MKKKKFTWLDLLHAISKLPVEQLNKQVCMSIEDEPTFRNVHGIETIPQDIYVNKDDNEDCGSLDDLQMAHGNDFRKKDYRLATKKGFPFLWDGF